MLPLPLSSHFFLTTLLKLLNVLLNVPFFPGQEGVDTTVKVATETAKLSSRTFLGHFPGPFKTIFQGLKFNFSYYSFISFFVPTI